MQNYRNSTIECQIHVIKLKVQLGRRMMQQQAPARGSLLIDIGSQHDTDNLTVDFDLFTQIVNRAISYPVTTQLGQGEIHRG